MKIESGGVMQQLCNNYADCGQKCSRILNLSPLREMIKSDLVLYNLIANKAQFKIKPLPTLIQCCEGEHISLLRPAIAEITKHQEMKMIQFEVVSDVNIKESPSELYLFGVMWSGVAFLHDLFELAQFILNLKY